MTRENISSTSYRKKRSRNTSLSNNRGSALFVVIIIIGVLVIFAFSLLLVSYTLYASQNKRAASLRCSEAANTLSEAMKGELEDEEAYSRSWLWVYLRYNLFQNSDKTWPYYDPNKAGHTSEYAYRYFNLKPNTNYGVEGFPGEIELCMYWTLPEDSVLEDDELEVASIEEKDGAHLYIDVICSSGSQSYTLQDKYRINVTEYTPADADKVAAIEDDFTNKKKNPLGNNIQTNEDWEFEYEKHKTD